MDLVLVLLPLQPQPQRSGKSPRAKSNYIMNCLLMEESSCVLGCVYVCVCAHVCRCRKSHPHGTEMAQSFIQIFFLIQFKVTLWVIQGWRELRVTRGPHTESFFSWWRDGRWYLLALVTPDLNKFLRLA